MPAASPPPIPVTFPKLNIGKLLSRGGYFVLPANEVREIVKSANPKNHVLAVKHVVKDSKVILIRGDLKTIFVPCFMWPMLGDSIPDFDSLIIEDFGLTIKDNNGYKIDAIYFISD